MERYGVFEMFVDGSPMYLGSADDFAEAETTMLDAARLTALECFVFDFELQRAVATTLEKRGPADNAGGVRAN